MINPSSRGLAGVFSSGDRHSTLAKTSPSEIIELMMTHPHVPHETRHALTLFRHLAEEVDMLRRYALLNFLAVTKVVKKHDKLSLLPLKGPLNSFVAAQPFHTGTRLLETFTSIRAFSSALVAMARGTQLLPPPHPAVPTLRPAAANGGHLRRPAPALPVMRRVCHRARQPERHRALGANV